MSVIHPRIVMVSNRLPVRLVESGGGLLVKESPGGLVRALGSIMRQRNRGDVWIGWAGISGEVDLDEALEETGTDLGYRLDAVPLTERENDLFYKGFSNEVIWPLFHDLHTYCNFKEEYWQAYLRINQRFAEHVMSEARPDDLIWVHDYHLMRVASDLRDMGSTARLGFFLHIPFPGPDVFRRLPWRDALLEGLLDYDVLGFQTLHDLNNFIQTVRVLRADVMVRRPDWFYEIHIGDHVVRAGTFPIGIDVDEIQEEASSPAVERRLESMRKQHQGRTVIMGADRLDYTKGIPARLDAFEQVLKEHPELHEKLVFIQHVAPSREDVANYADLKRQIERRVSEINGEYGTFDWTPVHYMYSTMDFADLLALYRLARIALVTPLKDGMNLVSMEYCAAQLGEPGVLVLSEFAGAAHCAKDGALLVNPHDTHQVADAIVRAAQMPLAERRRRHTDLMDAIRAHDVYEWVNSFLETGMGQSTLTGTLQEAEHLAQTHP